MKLTYKTGDKIKNIKGIYEHYDIDRYELSTITKRNLDTLTDIYIIYRMTSISINKNN